MTKALKALERLMADYYEMCQDLGNNDDQYQRCNLTSERAIIETALKKQEQDQEKLKALEMIKEIIPIEEEDFFYDEETDTYFFLGNKVSKKQYEFLKEVLKDGK